MTGRDAGGPGRGLRSGPRIQKAIVAATARFQRA